MLQLDYQFSDPPDGLTEVVMPCFWETAVPHHPRVPLAVRRETFARGVHAGPHQHCDFYALYLIRGGRGVHEINGVKYEIARGDAYLLAPGSVHGYRDYSDLILDGFYFPFGLLERREIEALWDLPGLGALFRGEKEAHARRLRLRSEQQNALETAIEKLRREYLGNDGAADFLLRAGFFALLIELARCAGDSENGKTRAPFGHALGVWEVRRFCEQTRGDLPTTRQMARWMNLSESHFRAVWKAEIGVSPRDFLLGLRLERAKIAIENGEGVQLVARREGFADAAHFCRAFKIAFGQSPRQFYFHSRTKSSNRAE